MINPVFFNYYNDVDRISVFTNIDLGEVRVINLNGMTYFCLADVCEILGIDRSRGSQIIQGFENYSTSYHKNENDPMMSETQHRVPNNYYAYIDTPVVLGYHSDGSPAIRMMKMDYVSEPGLYSVIFRSNKPKALEFQNWVYTSILPSIRRMTTDPDANYQQDLLDIAHHVDNNVDSLKEEMLGNAKKKQEQLEQLENENRILREQLEYLQQQNAYQCGQTECLKQDQNMLKDSVDNGLTNMNQKIDGFANGLYQLVNIMADRNN